MERHAQAEDVGQDATLEEGAEETEELQEVAAEAEAEAEVEDQEEDTAEAGEEDAEEDLPLTKEASHPKSAQVPLCAQCNAPLSVQGTLLKLSI